MYAVNLEIRELKDRYHRKMRQNNVPRRLWDYGLRHAAKLGLLIPRQKLEFRTPLEQVSGRTPDISEYLDFDFYDLVWYFPEKHPSISEENCSPRSLDRGCPSNWK